MITLHRRLFSHYNYPPHTCTLQQSRIYTLHTYIYLRRHPFLLDFINVNGVQKSYIHFAGGTLYVCVYRIHSFVFLYLRLYGKHLYIYTMRLYTKRQFMYKYHKPQRNIDIAYRV